MSESQATNPITPEELAKRKAAIQDAYNFSAYIPDDLRLRLETLLVDPAARTAVLELQILAIKYGRALERISLHPRIEVMQAPRDPGKRPSSLALKLVDRAGQVIGDQKKTEKPVDIIVAPGFLGLDKKD